MLAKDSLGESVAVGAGTCVIATGTVLGATSTDHTGPILAFAAAIFVALVTAVTTNRRQERALEADADRHHETLRAESKRLEQQLAHDRELADIAAVRSALDEAALALHRVGMVPMSFTRKEGDSDRIQASLHTEIQPARTRLVVRFGQGHALVEEFDACEHALWDWMLTVVYLDTFKDDESDEAKKKRKADEGDLNKASDHFDAAKGRFLDAAAKSAGTKLP